MLTAGLIEFDDERAGRSCDILKIRNEGLLGVSQQFFKTVLA